MVFSPGYSVGYLEQDPQLDPDKTVREVVEEGVLPVMALLKEYDEVNNAFADPDVLEDADKMNKLIERQAELQDKLDAADACCCSSPTYFCLTSRPTTLTRRVSTGSNSIFSNIPAR